MLGLYFFYCRPILTLPNSSLGILAALARVQTSWGGLLTLAQMTTPEHVAVALAVADALLLILYRLRLASDARLAAAKASVQVVDPKHASSRVP